MSIYPMESIKNQAQQTIAVQQERIAPYISVVMNRLVKTYGVPLLGLLIINIALVILNSVILGIVSGLFGTLITVSLYIGVMYMGLRFTEKRWNGTALFLAYTAVGKTRRILETEIESINPNTATAQQAMVDYVQQVDTFIELMNQHNITPQPIETD